MWLALPSLVHRKLTECQSMINVDFDFYNLNEDVDQ